MTTRRMFGDIKQPFAGQKSEAGRQFSIWPIKFHTHSIDEYVIVRYNDVCRTDTMARLRVALIAPPWLAMPVRGYGGIELVIESLIKGLRDYDVELEVFANGARKIRGIKTRFVYTSEQYADIHRPYYESLPILQAHLHGAINFVQRGNFDIVHDHNPWIGPSVWSLASRIPDMPPVIHTFHGPPFSTKNMLEQGLPDNRLQFDQIKNYGNFYGVCISEAMMRLAPRGLQSRLLPPVHNAVRAEDFPFVAKKQDYFITLARFSPDKGQHIAAKYAYQFKQRLRMAGLVAGIGSNRKLLFELANPLSPYRNNSDFRYYSDKVLPYTLNSRHITYAGNLSGQRKLNFIAGSRALLFPIDWEEPFGMAVIEALACGTPVVAMNRGAMPEIIEHGVNGFLADTEEEFADYMLRVNEIDPAECRRSVVEKFSTEKMAAAYFSRYQTVLKRARK